MSGWWGGGGGCRLTARKQPGQRFFVLLSFSPQLILQFTGPEKTILFKGRGGPAFLGGGGGGGVRVQVLISIETHITCDFPGDEEGPDPLSPPLDPHMVSSPDNSTSLHV